MIASNPLELYTIYFGWREYDVIWQACIQTGLAWVPFLGLFYENLTKPFETEIANGVDTSLRRVSIEFVIICFVIMFCVYPAVSLQTKDVTYKPYCSTNATPSTVGNTGTTYDNTFQSMIDNNVKVPMFYELVMDWSSGFTNALIAGTIPCDTNLNHMIDTIDNAHLPPSIQQQIQDFNNQCYLPAKAQFNTGQPSVNSYKTTMKQAGGEADLNWIGSKTLGQLYYGNMSASSPVTGFPYSAFPNSAIDDAIKSGQMTTPQWGYPTCEQWWSDSTYGLEHKISQSASASVTKNNHAGEIPLNDEMSAWLANHHLNIGSDLTADDVIAHGVLYDDVNHYGGFDNSAADVDTNNGISGDIAKPFVELGQTIQSMTGNAFKRDAISDVLPIVQAVMLFFVILFAALIHIFGRYRLGTCISLSFIIFGLIFSNYLWLILDYLENALINSSVTPLSLTSFGEHGTIENFMTIMYFAAPMMLMSLMSITGIKLGSAFNQMMMDSRGQADSVAKSGESATRDVAKTTVSLMK